MEPTLYEGEWVLIIKPGFALRAPRYGDLAVFTPDAAGDAWIKRVVGLPGDVLHAEDGQLYRNGEPVSERYLAETTPAFSAIKSWSDEYLVLGDHRMNSSDSREHFIGAIPRAQLHGRATFVVWPPSAWRSL
jgi:signal peptidase I